MKVVRCLVFVVVILGVMPRVVLAQGNLVANSGFESGTTGWTKSTNANLVTDDFRSGTQSVKLLGSASNTYWVGQQHTLGGGTYYAGVWVKRLDNLSQIHVELRPGHITAKPCTAVVGGWAYCSLTASVSPGTYTLYVLNTGGSASTSSVYIDDVYLSTTEPTIATPTPIPTPTTPAPTCEDYPIALSPTVTRLQLTGYNMDHVLYSLEGSVYIYGAAGWTEIMPPGIAPNGTPLSEFGSYSAGDIIGFRGLYSGLGNTIVLRACMASGGGGSPWTDAGGGGGPWETTPTPTVIPTEAPIWTPVPTATGEPTAVPPTPTTAQGQTIGGAGCFNYAVGWGGRIQLTINVDFAANDVFGGNLTEHDPSSYVETAVWLNTEAGFQETLARSTGDVVDRIEASDALSVASKLFEVEAYPPANQPVGSASFKICVVPTGEGPTATVAPTVGATPTTGTSGAICYRAAEALRSLLENSSIPYCWGGDVPNQYRSDLIGERCPTGSGLDCSGSFIWAYNQAGANWADADAATLAQQFAPVVSGCTLADLSGCAIGDAFFLSDDGTAAGVYHVSMYLGGALWGDCYNTSTGCQVWDVRGLSVYQTQLWGIGRPSVSEGWEPCPTNAPPVGNTGGTGIDFWAPIRWIWDQLRGILIPGPDDWAAIRDALLPLYDREPFGTVQDMNELIQVVRADMANPGEDAGLLWEVTAWDTGGGAVQAQSLNGDMQTLDGESGGGGSGWDDSGGGGGSQYTNWAHVLQGFSMWRLVASAGGWLNWMADRLPVDVMTFVKAVSTMLVWFGLYRYVRQRVVVTV